MTFYPRSVTKNLRYILMLLTLVIDLALILFYLLICFFIFFYFYILFLLFLKSQYGRAHLEVNACRSFCSITFSLYVQMMVFIYWRVELHQPSCSEVYVSDPSFVYFLMS